MTDYKKLCAELVAAIDASVPYATPLLNRARAALAEPEPEGPTDADLHAMAFGFAQPCFDFEYIPFARAVLARWGRPAPQPVADGEVAELVALIRQIALAWEPEATLLGNMTAGQLARAADLLAQRYPQPIPVSERLPGLGEVER
jgi:hypothetical protein